VQKRRGIKQMQNICCLLLVIFRTFCRKKRTWQSYVIVGNNTGVWARILQPTKANGGWGAGILHPFSRR